MSPIDERLTEDEVRAVKALQRLAKRWPQTLELMSMAGSLCVVHADDPMLCDLTIADRSPAILAVIDGIRNDGGDW